MSEKFSYPGEEALKNLSLALIGRELAKNKGEPPGDLKWLEESCNKPENFWHALKNTQDTYSPLTGKSIVLKQYDFFSDLITRHSCISAPAFRWYDQVLGWQEISYRELGSAVGRQAVFWAQSQVQPGQLLCILCPIGVKYVVSLLSAFKIGLKVSFLPPLGSGFVQRRLKALNPDYIVSEEIFFPLLQSWQDRILPDAGPGVIGPVYDRSYTYPAGTAIALCFDSSSQTPHIPRELTSDAAYLCPLRDGAIALGLLPGQAVAAPGFDFFETYPGLLLTSLLHGGTFIHLEPNDIAKNPKLLTAYPLRAIGISNQVRDILLKDPVEVGGLWSFWFRNPAEPLDFDRWQSFIQALKLKDVYAGNLKWESALGGCTLFSLRRKGQVHPNVLPSAGVPWCLTDLSCSGLRVLDDYGLFSPATVGGKREEKSVRVSILARSRKEWLFVGSLVSGRSGRIYPKAEILETIRDLPFCSSCSIGEVPVLSGEAEGPLLVLLIFTGSTAGMSEAEICRRIRNRIEREMGREFLPDRIQFFPLLPRQDAEGNIDHKWCQNQYLRGHLGRKSQREIYRCLMRLRESVRGAAHG